MIKASSQGVYMDEKVYVVMTMDDPSYIKAIFSTEDKANTYMDSSDRPTYYHYEVWNVDAIDCCDKYKELLEKGKFK